jgi:formamidopyrimidine-DNA glycosylase
MPELPEVETVRRGLAPVMAGARLAEVETRRPDLRFPLPDEFVRRLKGARVLRLDRRGKYLIAPLSTGESLIMHLGMSGRFTVEEPSAATRPGKFHFAPAPDSAHDHVVFRLDGARPARITYNDPRRFGFMDLAPSDRIDDCRHFDGMGPEPLSAAFDDAALMSAMRTRRAPLKAALLDQRAIAGLGNIYVCEALFRAGLSPRRSASSLGPLRAARLRAAIVAVLEEAVEAGGSSLKDFAGSDGALGYFQHRFRVYDREGAPCPVCGAPIRRLAQAGRSTFYCGKCQR